MNGVDCVDRATAAPVRRRRGGAALILLLLLGTVAAMLGALALRGAVTDLRAAGAQRTAKTGFYCAEAGLEAARAYFAGSYSQWSSMFGAGPPPAGYPVTGDIDHDGVNDYQVTLVDNDDELPPARNDRLRDNDLTAVMVSRCINPAMGSHQLQEIVVVNARGTTYCDQLGHCRAGNTNK